MLGGGSQARSEIVAVRWLFIVLLLSFGIVAAGCGDDDESDEGTVADATESEEVGPGIVIDAVVEDPCLGLKVEPSAKTYDDECNEIDECTQMPEQDGGCYCAYCGPKGGKVVCIQAQCALPN